MKLSIRNWLILFLLAVFLAATSWAVVPVIAASAEGDVTCATASGNYLNDDYIAAYSIPTGMFTYENNGGGNIAKAFDGDWNSYWQTNTENSGQQTDNPTFLNAITVTFNETVTIKSIAYASSSDREGWGYPITLNLYTANDGELSLYGTCNSSPTNNRVIFSFNEAVTVTQIKFEFRKVNTWHNWTATAKEICFLQPDSEEVNQALEKALNLFDDYAQLSVKDEYKTSLSDIRESVSGLISYENALKPLLDRAEAILDGHLVKDSRREFSTDPDAANVINRYGNLRNYAGSTLKMSSFGIDRQVTGVGGLAGDKITIYVEADEGDPLPAIAFNQVKGDWRSWQSTYNLSLGKNVFTFPNFITDNYSWTVVPGGAVHLINQYEPSRQSSNVKVYIEGGFLYPVFRKGGDVEAYRMEVNSYYNEMQNTEGMCDITELVCDHVIQTFGASTAYNNYVAGTVNPQKSAEGWDMYMKALLEFGGVSFNPEDEHYNEKNLHLYTNFRRVQPWAGAFAFAAGDHIGFIDISENSLANYSNNLGWGFAHEVGHALDVNGRTIGETTNNMWAKFATAYFENTVSRNFNDFTTNSLTNDESFTEGFFNTNRYNYQIWWNLEACHHGFWGKLDNMYRYFDENAARTAASVTSADGQLTSDERIVYYSSLVVGEDLGYYYERFGFSFDSNSAFKVENASSAYKKLMQKALSDEEIKDIGFKYWYIDADQYYYDITGEDYYDESSRVEIRDVWKTSSGYTVLLTEPEGSTPHLGYEIMEYRDGKWTVIGFTRTGSFTDTTEYPEGYVPQYKIKGYDREMSESAASEPIIYEPANQASVCRIGETYYNSLTEAVAAASAGDTIYVCKDLRDGAITINKNLTILPDPALTGSVVITKGAIGAMFTVSGATLTLGASDGAKIILDGYSFSQGGALINVANASARLNVYNAELRNNNNTGHGGAIYNEGGTTLTNVTIKDNVAAQNGGAIANFSGGVLTLTDCALTGNKAKINGGAIAADGRVALIRTAVTGNYAGNVGGAFFISPAKNPNSRYISAEGGEISGNTVGGNGSAFHLDKGIFSFENSEVIISGGIYKNTGTTINISAAAQALDLSGVTFQSASTAEGTALLTANGNFTFTEEFAAGIKVMAGHAYLSENSKTVLIKPNTATVTFTVNGTDITQEVVLGNFVLPNTAEGLGEDKFIASWESDGVTYAAGDTVKITGSCTFTAEVKSKFTVTLKYNDETVQTFYIEPDTKFYLPADGEFEQYSIMGWKSGGELYAPSTGVTITEDTVFEADLVRLYKVTVNGEDFWYGYAHSLTLGDCDAPEGKVLTHWVVDGVDYRIGETVLITGDTVITAVFGDKPADGGDDDDDGNTTTPPTGGDDGDNTQTPPAADGDNDSNPLVLIIIVAVILLLVVGLAVGLIFVIKRKKSASDYDEDDDDEEFEEYKDK